ncbi:hypothetical protein AHAS_Ahas01G0190200 [Arachis hypogaea]
MEISLTDLSSKKAFSPIPDKLNENNYSTWRYQACLTIQSTGMEDHLYAEKVPEQFITDPTKKIQSESDFYNT